MVKQKKEKNDGKHKILYRDESPGQQYLSKKIAEKIREKTGRSLSSVEETTDALIKEGYIQMGIRTMGKRIGIETEPLITEKGIAYLNLDKNQLTKENSQKWGVMTYDEWIKFRQLSETLKLFE